MQIVVDLATCGVTALDSGEGGPVIATPGGLIARWLAALCPFTANYTAVVLTETLVTFLTAAALLALTASRFLRSVALGKR